MASPPKGGHYLRVVPGAAYLLVVLIAVFGIFGSGFATRANVLNIGVQGKGNDVGAALHQIAGTIAISYKDSQVANQSFDLGKVK